MLKDRANNSNHAGFSLVELMISLAVGLIVLGGVTNIFSNTVSVNSVNLTTAHLNQDLRAVMDLMVRDIRKAGYWGGAECGMDISYFPSGHNCDLDLDKDGTKDIPPVTNPFRLADTLAFDDTQPAGTPDGDMDCILYSYDGDNNGQLAANEQYGFRLNDGAVESRQAGNTCDQTNWEDLTDPGVITITNLTFNQSVTNLPSGGTLHLIAINLTGQLNNHPEIARAISETVKIRN